MKIKVKKEMNLHQLIQWARENNVKGETFTSNYGRAVKFYSDVSFNTMVPIFHWDTFTVEAEEEITKDTKLDLIVRFLGRINSDALYTIECTSINEHLSRFADTLTTHFYVENEDRELVLIWKDGELV
ncbi:hypothetical protein LG056_000941 [Staphylococcus pseudintermedius]|nr:hypothetical protein [Staphylococcus pseudintermedius]